MPERDVDLNTLLVADRKTVFDLNTGFSAGVIWVDNSFQRRSVWTERDKVRLIESILTGYPMPEIYLWDGVPAPETGESRQSIVDGQQRLTAIRDFLAGGLPLRTKFLDEDNQTQPFAGKEFSELGDTEKQTIWKYKVNVRTIPNVVDKDEIVRMFLRLNQTDKNLNPQELRNAEFNGKFIKTVERVADLPFFVEHRVFTPHNVRRMKDLEFISSLLVYLRRGLQSEVDQRTINEVYDAYNDVYDEADADVEAASKVLDVIGGVFKADPSLFPFYKAAVHFYPLFVAIHVAEGQKKQLEVARLASRLKSFLEAYQANDERVEKYRAAATEGTQKRVNRDIRVKALLAWLTAPAG